MKGSESRSVENLVRNGGAFPPFPTMFPTDFSFMVLNPLPHNATF